MRILVMIPAAWFCTFTALALPAGIAAPLYAVNQLASVIQSRESSHADCG
jgi:hypothetical protein